MVDQVTLTGPVFDVRVFRSGNSLTRTAFLTIAQNNRILFQGAEDALGRTRLLETAHALFDQVLRSALDDVQANG